MVQSTLPRMKLYLISNVSFVFFCFVESLIQELHDKNCIFSCYRIGSSSLVELYVLLHKEHLLFNVISSAKIYIFLIRVKIQNNCQKLC